MKTHVPIHLPVPFYGELHDVHLVNFSVDWKEISGEVPAEIMPLFIAPGRVLISMVNVDLRNMRPFSKFFPFHFRYRHMAFRLLVDDCDPYDGPNRGIYFLRSFTNRRFIQLGGLLMNTFRLGFASVKANAAFTSFRLRQGDRFLSYRIDPGKVATGMEELHARISTIDRAYTVDGKHASMVRICREQWPLLPVQALDFRTNFFSSALLEGVFVVPQTIFYKWEKPVSITLGRNTQPFVAY